MTVQARGIVARKAAPIGAGPRAGETSMSENDPGGNDGNGEQRECPWPGCDYTSHSRRGISIHHRKKHGESVPDPTAVCDWCDESFSYRYREGYEPRFCSQSCMGDWMSENMVGEDANNWRGGKATLICKHCGGEYKEKQSHAEGSVFCSAECHADWMSENMFGEDAPAWGGGEVTLVCDQCGSEYSRLPARVDDARFCSLDCWGDWASNNLSGEDSHRWLGGEAPYGAGWNESKKELVRERDGRECRICGKSESEHLDEHDERLTVHHIVRARDSRDVAAEVRNSPFNLVSICRTHNTQTLEQIPSWVQFMAFLPHPPLPTEQATIVQFATGD